MLYINGKKHVFGVMITRGKSAYEIAVNNGFKGTEEEWLESLKAEGAGGANTEEFEALKELVNSHDTELKSIEIHGSLANLDLQVNQNTKDIQSIWDQMEPDDEAKGTTLYKHIVVIEDENQGEQHTFTLVTPSSGEYTDVVSFLDDCLLYGAVFEFSPDYITKITSVYHGGNISIVGFADDSDGFSGLGINSIVSDTVTKL